MEIPDVLSLDLLKIISDHYPEFDGVHPACLATPMIDQEGFAKLVESIAGHGLKMALLRTPDRLLLDGRTRLLACYVVGQEIHVEDDPGIVDPWETVNMLNMDRKHLTVGQKAMFAQAWREAESEAAKERQHKGRPPAEKEVPVILPEDTGDTRDKVGERVGVGGSSVDKAAYIQKHCPNIAKQVSNGKLTLEEGYKRAKAEVKKKNDEQKAKNAQPTEQPAAEPTEEQTEIVTAAGVVSLIAKPKSVHFNKTTDAVDWASWTWNPVTGCNHGCKFCYAREIAYSQRMAAVYPNQFEPTFHRYRLDAPRNTNTPDSADARDCRVFVCSMADLFGKWVPDEWIEAVFAACLGSPEWEYLFLTKWPERYSRMPLLEKAWYGASVIQQSDVSRVESSMSKFETPNATKWISLEPMLEPIRFKDLSWCDLVVIGSQTSTTQPSGYVPAFAPQFDWVFDVVTQCRQWNVPYYLKANLGLQTPGMELPKPLPRGR